MPTTMVKRFFLFASLALVFTMCVAPKKYQDLQAQKAASDERNVQLTAENEQLQGQLEQGQQTEAQQDLRILRLRDTIDLLQAEQRTLAGRYADLMKAQEVMQTNSSKEIRQLLEQIQQQQEALQRKQDELSKLERAISEREQAMARLDSELQKAEENLNERNQKLIALQQALAQKDSMAQALRKKVAEALLGFEGNGLSVTLRDGKVYVSLDEQLLFASGKFTVDERGQEAIKKLAVVLAQNPDINVTIEGHTDDVPYKGGGQLLDNWDLSVKRATSVVRIMAQSAGIEPSRITAAGRAEFVPLNDEKTSDARQANRRIEIILVPKLDEVLRLIEQ
ncbi:MAG: OmpA family protein [Prevotellaceae bacterium]|nr:OmpA family protein [Prevotellaceae bacterium]